METIEVTKPVYVAPFDTTTFSNMTARQYDSLPSEVEKEFRQGPHKEAFIKKLDECSNAPAQPRAQSSQPAPTPGQTSFDPSFDESPDGPSAPAKAAAQSAVEVQAEPVVEGEEKVHSYQPVDKDGRPVGGKQVFKYRTDAELIEKLTKAHSAASARIRTLSRDRLIEEVQAVATKYEEPKFLDPKDNPNAEAINKLTTNAVKNATLSALNLFQQNHPEYHRNNENAAVLIQYISRSGSDPGDAQTWDTAFDWAVRKNLLELAPVVAAIPAPVVEAPAPVRTTPAARPVMRPSTGLSNIDASTPDAPAEPIRTASNATGGQHFVLPDGRRMTITAAELDRIPSATLSRLMKNRENCARLEILYAEQDAARAARRR